MKYRVCLLLEKILHAIRGPCPRYIQKAFSVYGRYGMDEYLLGVTKVQGRVSLHGARFEAGRNFECSKSDPLIVRPSVEFGDGSSGLSGELGILRTRHGADQYMLLMKHTGPKFSVLNLVPVNSLTLLFLACKINRTL